MVQERTYAIVFQVLFILLLPCPLTSVRVKDVSTLTGNLSFYIPLFSIDNVTFHGDCSLMNESQQHSSGAAVVFSLPVSFSVRKVNSSVCLNKEFSVHGSNGPVLFLFSEKLVIDEPVLAVEFGSLLVSNDLFDFKNGDLVTPGSLYHRRNKCPNVWFLHPINRISEPILSSKFNLGNQFLPLLNVGISASEEDRNAANLVLGNWSFQIFRSETSQFENYGNGDVLLGVYTPVLAVISIFSALWSYFKKLFKGNEDTPPNPNLDSTISGLLVGFRKFTYSELSSATKYFHQSELLGDGIVASVYRAYFPGSINIYAVKRFNQSSSSKQCYETEVRRIHNLRHKNILELRGWCNENPNEPLLLYDYMPNRSLHDVLSSGKILLWPYRYNIAVGLAKALVYLHHECTPNVIHTDIKEENVLLDAELNPKLADFGLSLTGPSTVSSPRSTEEYPTESQLQEWMTPKIDVFLYGSLVLELCCRRTEAYRVFIRNLRNLQLQGRVLEAVDEKLGGNYNEEEMLRVLTVGIECVDEEISNRPSMQEVLEILSSEGEVEEGSPNLIIEIHE